MISQQHDLQPVISRQNQLETKLLQMGLLDTSLMMEHYANFVKQTAHLVVIQVNGKYLLGNQISFEGKSRCKRVVSAFMSGEVPNHSIIVTTGYGRKGQRSEADAFKSELVHEFDQVGWTHMEEQIHPENQATNTFENVKYTAKLIQKLKRKQPEAWFIATTDYHYTRQEITHAIIPEKSEFRIIRDQFPYVNIFPLKAPYPFSKFPNIEKRWLAEVYVTTHSFAPLLVNLYALGEGKIQHLFIRNEALDLLKSGIKRLRFFGNDIHLPEDGAYKRHVDIVMRDLAIECAELSRLCDDIEEETAKNPDPGDENQRRKWSALADSLKKHTNSIRFASDPDQIL